MYFSVMNTQTTGSQKYPYVVRFANVCPKILLHAYVNLTSWSSAFGPDPFWRIYWNADCGASINFNGKLYPLLPENIYLIPPDLQGIAHLSNPVNHFFIHFSFESSLARITPQILSFPTNSTTRRLIDTIMNSASQNLLGSFSGEISLFELIFTLFAEVPNLSWQEGSLDRRIIRAMDVMEDSLEMHKNLSTINNSFLAKTAHMSVDAFIRLFSSQMKVPPMQYFLERRLQHASLKLLHSDLSIEQIASDAGFCDRNHLSKSFEKKYAQTPAAYRKKCILKLPIKQFKSNHT